MLILVLLSTLALAAADLPAERVGVSSTQTKLTLLTPSNSPSKTTSKLKSSAPIRHQPPVHQERPSVLRSDSPLCDGAPAKILTPCKDEAVAFCDPRSRA